MKINFFLFNCDAALNGQTPYAFIVESIHFLFCVMIIFIFIIIFIYLPIKVIIFKKNLSKTFKEVHNFNKKSCSSNIELQNVSIFKYKNNVPKSNATGICVYLSFKRLNVSFLDIIFKKVFSIDIEEYFLTLFLTNELNYLHFTEVKCFQLLHTKNKYLNIYFYCFFKPGTDLNKTINMKFAKKKVDLLVDQVFIKSNDLVIHESYCHLFYPI